MPPQKSKLSRRGYILMKDELSPEELSEVRTELSVTPVVPQFGPFPVRPTPIKVFKEGPTKMYLPRFYGQDKWGAARKVDFPPTSDRSRMQFTAPLLPHQVDIVAKSLEDLRQTGGAFLCLPCGFGKTICAIYLACQLKQRTLIVVHKTFLMDQWVERIQQFLPDAKIGVIRGKTLDIGDNDFVIGMLQSLSMKDYEEASFDAFGTVIVDEAHHIGSEVFSRALPLVQTRYMIGLSATPNRKDGLSRIFHWYLGPVTSRVQRKETMGLLIQRVFLPQACGLEEITNRNGQAMVPSMLTELAELGPRNEWMVRRLLEWMEEPARAHPEEPRQILVLGDRIRMLEILKAAVDGRSEGRITTGYYIGAKGGTGKKKQAELKASESCNIIFATFAMAKEGLDIPSLNMLLLATPVSDVEQAVGRVLRKPHKCRPVVIDMVDTYSESLQRQGLKRYRWYKKQGYEVLHHRCVSFDAAVPDPIAVSAATEDEAVEDEAPEQQRNAVNPEEIPFAF